MNSRFLLDKLIAFFVAIIEVILGLRILFRLFDANSAAPFVDWIYTTSDTIMTPFRGIFPVAQIERGVTLDIPAIFAAIMYMIIGYLLIAVIDFLTPNTAGMADADVVETRPARTKRARK